MRFAPSWARGEGAVTSLLRMLGTAATKALNRPVALVVLTARRGRIRVCRPREVRSGHGSRRYTRKHRMSNPESEILCSAASCSRYLIRRCPISASARPPHATGALLSLAHLPSVRARGSSTVATGEAVGDGCGPSIGPACSPAGSQGPKPETQIFPDPAVSESVSPRCRVAPFILTNAII